MAMENHHFEDILIICKSRVSTIDSNYIYIYTTYIYIYICTYKCVKLLEGGRDLNPLRLGLNMRPEGYEGARMGRNCQHKHGENQQANCGVTGKNKDPTNTTDHTDESLLRPPKMGRNE